MMCFISVMIETCNYFGIVSKRLKKSQNLESSIEHVFLNEKEETNENEKSESFAELYFLESNLSRFCGKVTKRHKIDDFS